MDFKKEILISNLLVETEKTLTELDMSSVMSLFSNMTASEQTKANIKAFKILGKYLGKQFIQFGLKKYGNDFKDKSLNFAKIVAGCASGDAKAKTVFTRQMGNMCIEYYMKKIIKAVQNSSVTGNNDIDEELLFVFHRVFKIKRFAAEFVKELSYYFEAIAKHMVKRNEFKEILNEGQFGDMIVGLNNKRKAFNKWRGDRNEKKNKKNGNKDKTNKSKKKIKLEIIEIINTAVPNLNKQAKNKITQAVFKTNTPVTIYKKISSGNKTKQIESIGDLLYEPLVEIFINYILHEVKEDDITEAVSELLKKELEDEKYEQIFKIKIKNTIAVNLENISYDAENEIKRRKAEKKREEYRQAQIDLARIEREKEARRKKTT